MIERTDLGYVANHELIGTKCHRVNEILTLSRKRLEESWHAIVFDGITLVTSKTLGTIEGTKRDDPPSLSLAVVKICIDLKNCANVSQRIQIKNGSPSDCSQV